MMDFAFAAGKPAVCLRREVSVDCSLQPAEFEGEHSELLEQQD